MNLPKILILLSGGLDSVTLLYDLKVRGYTLHCLSLDYKQPHLQELLRAEYHSSMCGAPHTILDIPKLGGLTEESWIVPNRNAIFLSLGVNVAAQLGFQVVAIACNKDDADYFPDCRPEFIAAMNAAVKAAGLSIEIQAPYVERSKAWIGGLAQELGVKPTEIWTCYMGGPQPCGKCPACEKLKLAFA